MRPAEKIREFVCRHMDAPDGTEGLLDDDEIFARGLVDSLFALQLVSFVEEEFGVVVADADLDLANFRSVRAIARLIESKGAGGG